MGPMANAHCSICVAIIEENDMKKREGEVEKNPLSNKSSSFPSWHSFSNKQQIFGGEILFGTDEIKLALSSLNLALFFSRQNELAFFRFFSHETWHHYTLILSFRLFGTLWGSVWKKRGGAVVVVLFFFFLMSLEDASKISNNYPYGYKRPMLMRKMPIANMLMTTIYDT